MAVKPRPRRYACRHTCALGVPGGADEGRRSVRDQPGRQARYGAVRRQDTRHRRGILGAPSFLNSSTTLVARSGPAHGIHPRAHPSARGRRAPLFTVSAYGRWAFSTTSRSARTTGRSRASGSSSARRNTEASSAPTRRARSGMKEAGIGARSACAHAGVGRRLPRDR